MSTILYTPRPCSHPHFKKIQEALYLYFYFDQNTFEIYNNNWFQSITHVKYLLICKSRNNPLPFKKKIQNWDKVNSIIKYYQNIINFEFSIGI